MNVKYNVILVYTLSTICESYGVTTMISTREGATAEKNSKQKKQTQMFKDKRRH